MSSTGVMFVERALFDQLLDYELGHEYHLNTIVVIMNMTWTKVTHTSTWRNMY